MIPFLLTDILITLGVVLFGTTIVALNWDKLIIALKGKRVAILGARGVGKTQLLKFLTTGSLPAEYKQTVASEKADGRRFQLKDLDLILKRTRDLSGDNAAYGEWKALHDEADLVFYLLRADRIIERDEAVESRVRADIRHIAEWLKAREEAPRLFIVGTHCDLDPAFTTLSADQIGNYVDRFRKLPIVAYLVARVGGSQQVKIALGSLKTIDDTEKLVYELFLQVAP
jgi:hypothetical protein